MKNKRTLLAIAALISLTLIPAAWAEPGSFKVGGMRRISLLIEDISPPSIAVAPESVRECATDSDCRESEGEICGYVSGVLQCTVPLEAYETEYTAARAPVEAAPRTSVLAPLPDCFEDSGCQ